MNLIVITTTLCANIILMGFSEPLTAKDNSVIRRSQQVCLERYLTCPASVTKTRLDSYQVMCK